MKVKKSELQEMVRKVVREKLAGSVGTSLKEGSDFTARRKIVALAKNTSMEFESTLLSELGVTHPDQMPEPLQRKYYEIVKNMEKEIVSSAMKAVGALAMFPKEQTTK
jgi:hypothetical protein